MYEYYSAIELFNYTNNKLKFRSIQKTIPIITNFSSHLVGNSIKIYYTINNGGSNIKKVRIYSDTYYVELVPTYINGEEFNSYSNKGVGFNYTNFNSYPTDNVNVKTYDIQLTDIIKGLYKFSIDVTNDMGTATQTLNNTIDMTTLGITRQPDIVNIISSDTGTPYKNNIIYPPTIISKSINLINDGLKLIFTFNSPINITNITISLDSYYVNVIPIYINDILSFNSSNTGNNLSYKNLLLTPLVDKNYMIELILTNYPKNNNNYNFNITISNDYGTSMNLVYPSLEDIRNILLNIIPSLPPLQPSPSSTDTSSPSSTGTSSPSSTATSSSSSTGTSSSSSTGTSSPSSTGTSKPSPNKTPSFPPSPNKTPFYETVEFFIIISLSVLIVIALLYYYLSKSKKK